MSNEPPRGPDEPSAPGGEGPRRPLDAPVVSLRPPVAEVVPPDEGTFASLDLEGLPRGTQLGRYVLLGRLARRSDAVVYAAFDPESDHKVVLKLYDPGGDDDETTKRRCLRLVQQGQALAKLDHPCIERILEAGIFGERVFLAAEFVDGLDVRQWMEARDEPFPWPEVLRVFREAGRGLSAAHKAGVVHRDFRPSNVLMGTEGRIVVKDFGLASEVVEEDGDVEISQLRESLEAKPPDDTEPIPTIAGTPAYLAPEQHLSGHADFRSDQFSFCVALYEALYGERPFSGNRPRALALEAAKHKVRPAPPGSGVPAWLRTVVLRGLSPRPDDRFQSMEALLRELARDPSARRRRWALGAVAAAGLAAAGAGSMMLLEADAAVCEDTSTAMDDVWTTERREQLRESFVATGRRWAEPSWRYTESKLDAWSDNWRDYTRLACLATRVWGNAGERTYELRVACLDRNLAELDATLEVLATVDGPMLDHSHRLAQQLPDPRLCTDTATVMVVGLPAEEQREAVETLHRELAALEARLSLGRALAVQRETNELLPRITATEDQALAARGQLVLGRAALALSQPDAEPTLHRAAQTALEVGHAPRAIEAWTLRIDALVEQGRAAEAVALSDYVDAMLVNRRFGWLRPGVEVARGHAERTRGRPAEALRHYYAAVEREEERTHPDPLRLLPAWLGQSDVLDERDEVEEARLPLTTALDVTRSALGPQHPELVEVLRRLGRLAQRQGHLAEARHHFEQALEIVHLSDDPSPSLVATLERSVGSIHAAEGDAAAAALHLQRAFEGLGGSEAAAQPEVFRSGVALARSQRALSRSAEARALLESLLLHASGDAPLPALEVAEAELLLADLQWDDGLRVEGRDHAARALARLGDAPAHRARRREAEQWLAEHSDGEPSDPVEPEAAEP
ncbi:MAG: serine/threonine protein kinase [Myxococcales bacterium]|nr:serine/threonine protein kinase [Myxococcales bacterium]MCB9717900.1 serine/threonine protein kinase [Myxococcales bacterium]